jgi:hypothetical protein
LPFERKRTILLRVAPSTPAWGLPDGIPYAGWRGEWGKREGGNYPLGERVRTSEIRQASLYSLQYRSLNLVSSNMPASAGACLSTLSWGSWMECWSRMLTQLLS